MTITRRLGVLSVTGAILVFAAVVEADEPPRRLITVTGDAVVKVAPDEVVLTLGVETSSKDLAAAKRENDMRVAKILELLDQLGIEAKDVQTDHITIEPRYQESQTDRPFRGFFVQKAIAINLHDVTKFEALLSGVLDAGVTNVHGVDFRSSQLRKHKDRARLLAITAAKEKATDLAGALDQTVGSPYSIQENQVNAWYGQGSRWGPRWAPWTGSNATQNIGSDVGHTGSIALGRISITARVTVSFELEG